MFAKRQLPYVAPDRLRKVAGLGTFALECDASIGIHVYFHAEGDSAATVGYLHFIYKFGTECLFPRWIEKPVHFGIPAGTDLHERVVSAARAAIEKLMEVNQDLHLLQAMNAVGQELAAERRRAALSWKPLNLEGQARLAIMRRIDACLGALAKSPASGERVSEILATIINSGKIAA